MARPSPFPRAPTPRMEDQNKKRRSRASHGFSFNFSHFLEMISFISHRFIFGDVNRAVTMLRRGVNSVELHLRVPLIDNVVFGPSWNHNRKTIRDFGLF